MKDQNLKPVPKEVKRPPLVIEGSDTQINSDSFWFYLMFFAGLSIGIAIGIKI